MKTTYMLGAGSEAVVRDLHRPLSFTKCRPEKNILFTHEELKETVHDEAKSRTVFVFMRDMFEYYVSANSLRVLN